LTTKKEKKAYEITKQYTRLGKSYMLEFNISAIEALDNFISENPGTIYREDALYLKVEATTNLALNSTFSKKKERLEEAKAAYENLMKYYPETKYSRDANNMADKVNKELTNFSVTENLSK
jgi:outer membrane protein assembly factor BamD